MEQLLDVVGSKWTQDWHERAESALKQVLSGAGGGRYPSSAEKSVQIRAPKLGEDGAPFAALIHPSNPSSGPYAGMSFVVFPSSDSEAAMVALVVGTLGLGDDAAALSRPGHARRVRALCDHLNKQLGRGDLIAWAKSDPTQIEAEVPDEIRRRFPAFEAAFRRYGGVIYGFCVPDPQGPALRTVVSGFLDLAMRERSVLPLTAYRQESESFAGAYISALTPDLSAAGVAELLSHRRYAIIEGPPGTGKTRLALEVMRTHYAGLGQTVQFHPSTTYEQFVGGLLPVTAEGQLGLQFTPTPGVLMRAAEAARACAPSPYLLHVDEVNRADLAKVLGEAIYLLEFGETTPRRVDLPYEFPSASGGSQTLELPSNLHVLGTMNSADRSIAILDLAIRRRFAFLKLWPQRKVVQDYGSPELLSAFDALFDIFLDHASDESFQLMPGHSYFLRTDGVRPRESLMMNLVPLLEEYIAQGYVPGVAEHIHAYIQTLESQE